MLNYEQRELLKVTAAAVSRGDLEQNDREMLDTWIVGEYNGWSNYPTWNVALWLDNDRGLYESTRELVRLSTMGGRNHDNIAEGVWTEAEAIRFTVADALKAWVCDDLDPSEHNGGAGIPDLGATMAADLLGYALGEVDWDEIAASWIEVSAEVESLT